MNDKLDVLDFSFDLDNRYTFWSGITGGLFLSLSYFGTDQSQVQRYLSGKSLLESQRGLIMNGFLKIPMQFFILLIGVLVFIFFQYEKTPINFNPYVIEKVKETDKREDFNAIIIANEIIHLEKQKHLKQKDGYSHAVDVVAYDGSDVVWEINVYDDICDAFKQAAIEKGVSIKWGAAWSEGDIRTYKGNAEFHMNRYIDRRRSEGRRPFIDGPHFELIV